MKQYINYIKEIIGTDLKGTIVTFEDLVSFFIMNSEASDDEIEESNMYFDRRLPNEYKFFLNHYNGGTLFKIEDFAGFKFLGTNELTRHNEFQRENFGGDWDDRIILFCECIGNAEYLGFKLEEIGSFQIVYCVLDVLPEEWTIVESSFEIFMNKLIEGKGREYWLD